MSDVAAPAAARWVREDVRRLPAYSLHQVECRHKLDQNEVPWDFPDRLKRAALARLQERDWSRYPDFHSDRLRALLGSYQGWPAEGVLVGNGSNELLAVALEALAGPGVEVLGAHPGFGLYEGFVRRSGAQPKFLPPRSDLALPFEELMSEIESDPTRPLLLCSPNNPTGQALAPERVEALLEALDAPLLLDNAYGEFCRWDYRPLLEKHENLLLFRTFSKAWSLGGIRLGYLLASPQLVAELIKIKLPYNLGHAGAVIGEVAMEHPRYGERSVRLLIGRREQWTQMLRDAGLEVFDSEANFLLVRSGDSAALRRGLAEQGILVREVGHYPGLGGCLRISVGSGPALRDTRRVLEEMVAASAGDSR